LHDVSLHLRHPQVHVRAISCCICPPAATPADPPRPPFCPCRVFSISVDDSTDVAELKRRVEEQDPQWEVQRQRLIYQGSELRDQDLLSQCGLEENSPSVHLVMRLPQPGTSRSKKTKEEPSTVPKAARSTRSAVKAEPVDDSLDSAYETLGGSLAGRLDLSADDVLGDCRFVLSHFQHHSFLLPRLHHPSALAQYQDDDTNRGIAAKGILLGPCDSPALCTSRGLFENPWPPPHEMSIAAPNARCVLTLLRNQCPCLQPPHGT